MRTAIYRGALTFASGIACGSVAYAARNDILAVLFFVVIVAALMALLTVGSACEE